MNLSLSESLVTNYTNPIAVSLAYFLSDTNINTDYSSECYFTSLYKLFYIDNNLIFLLT